GAALEDEVVLTAGPDTDRVAVRVHRDRVARTPPREQQRPRGRVTSVHDLVPAFRTGWEADELATIECVLPVRRAHDDRPLDDEEPFFVVLVVIGRRALAGREVV